MKKLNSLFSALIFSTLVFSQYEDEIDWSEIYSSTDSVYTDGADIIYQLTDTGGYYDSTSAGGRLMPVSNNALLDDAHTYYASSRLYGSPLDILINLIQIRKL